MNQFVDLIKFTNSSRTYEYTETLIKNNEILESILGIFKPRELVLNERTYQINVVRYPHSNLGSIESLKIN